MSNGTEFRAKTVEAATAEAEEQLGKTRDQLEIQVLSQGSKGVFGIGGEPARILARDPSVAASPVPASPKVTPQINAPLVPEPVAQVPPATPLSPEPSRRPAAQRRPRSTGRPPADRNGDAEEFVGDEYESVGEKLELDPVRVAASAQEIVQTMLAKMGFEVEVSVRANTDPVTLDVSGEDLGILIGRRGDSLASLQFMVNVILSKEFHTWPRVVVDVQGYRARREQSLASLGERVAERVRRNRRPFTLEAMPANDRRVIHLSLRDNSDVETYSIGEGPTRRVVVAPKGQNHSR